MGPSDNYGGAVPKNFLYMLQSINMMLRSTQPAVMAPICMRRGLLNGSVGYPWALCTTLLRVLLGMSEMRKQMYGWTNVFLWEKRDVCVPTCKNWNSELCVLCFERDWEDNLAPHEICRRILNRQASKQRGKNTHTHTHSGLHFP